MANVQAGKLVNEVLISGMKKRQVNAIDTINTIEI